MRQQKIDVGSGLVALGALLLLVSLFLEWYAPSLAAFDAFEFLDWLLVACALAVLVGAGAMLGGAGPHARLAARRRASPRSSSSSRSSSTRRPPRAAPSASWARGWRSARAALDGPRARARRWPTSRSPSTCAGASGAGASPRSTAATPRPTPRRREPAAAPRAPARRRPRPTRSARRPCRPSSRARAARRDGDAEP